MHLSLDELENKLRDGRETSMMAIEKLKALLLSIEDRKSELELLQSEVNVFKEGCKAVKAAGTGVGAVSATCATVGFGAAFFTGGASLSTFAGEIAGVIGLTGAAANISSNVADKNFTKQLINKINDVGDKLKAMNTELEKTVDTPNDLAEFLQNNFNLSKDESWSVMNSYCITSQNSYRGPQQMGAIGTFVTLLAMAEPCSTESGAALLTPLAQNLTTMEPVVAPEILLLAGKSVENAVEIESASQLVETTEEVVVNSAGALFKKGVQAGMGIFFFVLDTVLLIRYSKRIHPAIEAIDKVMNDLVTIETDVKNRLDAMVRVAITETKTTETSDNNRFRVYDKSPQTILKILRKGGISNVPSPEYDRRQTAPDLIRNLGKVLETTLGDFEGDFTFSFASYLTVIAFVEELIVSHNATIKQVVGTSSSSIQLIAPSCKELGVIFDSEARNCFRSLLLPVQATLKVPLADSSNLGCVYRLRCLVCDASNEFNHIGHVLTSKTLDHEAWLDSTEVKHLIPEKMYKNLSPVLQNHLNLRHANVTNFNDVFEVDVVHRLPDKLCTISATDERAHHSWGVFYRWLYCSNNSSLLGGE